jgi:hypothetical protein
MKRTILFSLLIILCFCAFSQDIIITNSGKEVNCKITQIDSINIYLTIISKGRQINTYICKSDVKEMYFGKTSSNFSSSTNDTYYTKKSMTIGFLEGGGSLLGVDVELMPFDRFGIQIGFGYIGFGCGINIHLKPSTKSSYFSLQYWHQGFRETYTQSLIGPSFVFRGKKWFTAQLGVGYTLENGPAWGDKGPIPIMLTYAIGVYVPY